MASDDDTAVFLGNSSANNLQEIYQQYGNVGVNFLNFQGTFDTANFSDVEYLYAASWGYSGSNAFSGGINGDNIVNLAWEFTDLARSNFSASLNPDNGTYSMSANQLQLALSSASWSPASPTGASSTSVFTIDENWTTSDGRNGRGDARFDTPDGAGSVRVFRTAVVPEPSCTLLIALGAIGFLKRRRR